MKQKKCRVMGWYRAMRKCYLRGLPLLPRVLHHVIRVVYSCELPMSCRLAEDVFLGHNGLGVVIHGDTRVGAGSRIYQNVTLGGRNGQGGPIIGKDVFIGAGACVLGEISVGDGASVGANAVVLEDVPAGAVVAGVPARRVR